MTQVDEGPDSPTNQGTLTFGAPTVGEVLAERYQLQQHISDDAFGRQVWRGIDVVLRRPVAVVLRCPGGEAAIEMLDAAVSASRVTHPHLVDVYDAIDEGARAYVVREWVDGGSLRDYVRETPMDPDRATTVACAVASALAAVHATGSAHGNVHPGTVLIGSDGRVVLSDARADESVSPDLDVRAVGAVLYAALTGHWPHAEAGVTALPDAVRDPNGTIAAPRQVRGGVPGHLSDLAMDLLDKNQPPPSADVLAADLGRLSTEDDDELIALGGPLTFTQSSYGPLTSAEPHRPIGKKLAIGVAGLLAIALIGLLVALQFLPSSNSGASVAPSATGGSALQPSAAAGRPQKLKIGSDQVQVVTSKLTADNADDVAKVVDGNPDTAWYTQHYKNDPHFGNLKPGLGIVVDLGAPKPISSIEVDFTSPGATVQLFTGNSVVSDSKLPSGYQAASDVVASVPSNKVFPVDGDAARYVLVWITSLPPAADNPSQYRVGISEISVSVDS